MGERNSDRNLPGSPVARARELRQSATLPERLLWSRLRAGRLGGLKFRRQHPIGPYTADFYCDEAVLVIEVDGMAHDWRQRDDARRDAWMRARNIGVLRISAMACLRDLEGVAAYIHREAKRRVDEGRRE